MPTATPESPLPHIVDVFKLAVQGASLNGQFEAQHLPRLNEAVQAITGSVQAELEFFIGDEGFVEILGSVSGEVSLSCQRCLGEMRQTLSSEIKLGVVRKEEDLAGLPRRLDPWLIDSESSDLCALLEDELLLNLPIVALHQSDACEPGPGLSFGEETGASISKENPFQVLEQFKKPR